MGVTALRVMGLSPSARLAFAPMGVTVAAVVMVVTHLGNTKKIRTEKKFFSLFFFPFLLFNISFTKSLRNGLRHRYFLTSKIIYCKKVRHREKRIIDFIDFFPSYNAIDTHNHILI